MDVPPGLLALADQVYAGMLNEFLWRGQLLLEADDFMDEFKSRLLVELWMNERGRWAEEGDDPECE